MVALSKIKGLFPDNPFVAGFGNKVSFILLTFIVDEAIPPRIDLEYLFAIFQAWDILAYKALNIDPNMIYKVMEDSSLVVEGTGVQTSYDNLINNVTTLFPQQNSL